jgi:D-serine deaminase-like pyridoxal phosphate-dependent protein
VQTPVAAAELAGGVARTEGVELLGLMTYPTSEHTRHFMDAARELLERRGLTVRIVSGGGTPTLYRTHELGGVTEVRAEEYVLSEEHAHVDVSRCVDAPTIGERVTVLPNHVRAAVNLHHEVALRRSGRDVEVVPVPARGRVR